MVNTQELNKEKEYEQIKQENEWLAKSNLEMIYKYGEGLSKEEIERLINRPDWKEKTGFKISEGWGTTIGTGSKGISYRHNRSAFSSTYKPIYLISLKKREIKMMKELTNQLALNQTIEEKTVDKWKKKFSRGEMDGLLTIKKEFESLNKQLEEKELFIEHLENRIEEEEIKVESHLDALERAQAWREWQRGLLEEEIKNKSEILEENRKLIEKQGKENIKLQSELENESELLREARKIIEKQELELYLSNKPLPKTPSKFKVLKERVKTNFKQFQQLIKKTRIKTQEFAARIEVKVK